MTETVAPYPGMAFEAKAATVEDIAYCFRLLLGRAPSAEEWTGHVAHSGQPLAALVGHYVDSREFAALHRNRALRPPVRTEIDGIVVFSSEDDLAVGRLVAAGTWEPGVAATFRRLLRPGMTVLDLGANIGFFTMLAARLVGPIGLVTAVEPNLGNVRLLEASRRANGFDHVTVVPCAVAARPGMLVLESAYSNGITHPVGERDFAALTEAVLVPCVPVEAVLPTGRRLDFIKIDIEGAEHVALAGCAEILRRDRPIIVTEFSPGLLASNSGVAAIDYLRLLQSLGYALAVIGDDGGASGATPEALLAQFEAEDGERIDLLCTPEAIAPRRGWMRPALRRMLG